MKAAVLNANVQSFEEISVVEDATVPSLLSGTVLVRVVRAAINPIDNMLVRGIATQAFGWVQPFPYIPGEDFSGVVHAVAEDVQGFAVGDEVFASNWGQGRHDDLVEHPIVGGAFAEYMLIPASKLSRKPAEISHAQAAALGIAGTTAYECLFSHGQISSSTRLLVLGGASAVGQFAVQIAKLHGAFVAVTCSSRTLDFVQRELGADLVLDYTTQDWAQDERVKGFDVVFDCVGEKDGLARATANGTVKADGVFVSIADFSIGLDPKAHPPLRFGAAICFLQSVAAQDQLAQWVAQGKLKVFFDEEFSLDSEGVRGVFNKIASGKSVGKNILRVSE